MSELHPVIKAAMYDDQAVILLQEAEASRPTDPAVLAAIANGYAALAVAAQVAALGEAVEGLSERMEELPALADVPRRSWWRRFLAWWDTLAGPGPVGVGQDGDDADVDQAAEEGLAAVYRLPFVSGGDR